MVLIFQFQPTKKKIKDIFADARHFSNIFRVLLDTKCGSSLVFECIYGLSDALKSALSLDRNESYSKVFPFFFLCSPTWAYGFSSHFSWTFFSTVITKVQMRQGEPNLKKRQTFDKNMLLHQQQRIRVTHKQWICVYSCCLI